MRFLNFCDKSDKSATRVSSVYEIFHTYWNKQEKNQFDEKHSY